METPESHVAIAAGVGEAGVDQAHSYRGQPRPTAEILMLQHMYLYPRYILESRYTCKFLEVGIYRYIPGSMVVAPANLGVTLDDDLGLQGTCKYMVSTMSEPQAARTSEP